jgi:hypothetical protein
MKLSILKKDAKKGFLYLEGINRPIAPGQVTKLAKSLNRMGCIRPVVVAKIKFLTGKEELYIIDGQHLFNALLRNNMDIPYIEISISSKVELVETIALLNASSKSWTMLDYLSAWGSIHEDYKELRNYFNIYDFDIRTLCTVLSGTPGHSNSSNKLKKGEFRIGNKSEAIIILDNLTEVLEVAPRLNRFENSYFCEEYVKFIRLKGSSYKHATFLKRLGTKKEELLLVTHEEGGLASFFEKWSK